LISIAIKKTLRAWSYCLPILAGLILSACGGTGEDNPESGEAQGRLRTVLDRGTLICGVSGELPGFSYLDQQGEYAGLDVEVCRAIAAALFDDPQAVEFRNLNAKERFTAVQTGEIDVLSRNTSWTISRDTSVGMEFAPVVFYDGQGMMVRKAGGIQSLNDLKNASVCIQTGTTHEQNLADQARQRQTQFQPLVFEDVNAMFTAYAGGRCDAVTADRSALTSRRTTLPNPEEHQILEEVISKEPLAPAVADGDAQWSDVVKWTVFATIEAEELGISSQNLEQFTNSNDPTIRRFLGSEGEFGRGMGLSNDFTARILRHVGNYEEIYDRNLGSKTELALARGPNRLWTEGGLLYSPPFR
jgi:general L-amino acid transport system substrate-binding protein